MLRFFSTGREYTVTVKGAVAKTTRCESCKRIYSYLLQREAKGVEFSALGLFDSWAQQTAKERANDALLAALENGFDPVPCPDCGWYQARMCRLLQRKRYRWLVIVGGIGLAAVAFLALINADAQTLVPWSEFTLYASAAPLIFVLRQVLCGRYDPNDEDAELRIAQGKARCLPQTPEVEASTFCGVPPGFSSDAIAAESHALGRPAPASYDDPPPFEDGVAPEPPSEAIADESNARRRPAPACYDADLPRHRFTTDRHDSIRVTQFVDDLAHRCPEGAGCLPTIGVAAPLAAAFFFLGAYLGNDWVGFGLFLTWIATLAVCLYFYGRAAYRVWFIEHVIEPAEALGIDPSLIVMRLDEMRRTRPKTPHVLEMVNKVDILKRLIEERRRRPGEEEA